MTKVHIAVCRVTDRSGKWLCGIPEEDKRKADALADRWRGQHANLVDIQVVEVEVAESDHN